MSRTEKAAVGLAIVEGVVLIACAFPDAAYRVWTLFGGRNLYGREDQ